MVLKLGEISPYVALVNKLDSMREWAVQLMNDAKIGRPTEESHGNVIRAIERDMSDANKAWFDIRDRVGMPVTQNGLILGTHRNRPDGEFVVLAIVRASDGPFDVEAYIKAASGMKLGMGMRAYTAVWFQPTDIPEPIHEG